jgi:ABC-2 type transport system permease protein
MRYLRLLLLSIRVSVQNDAAYRVDFVLQFGGALLHVASMLLGLWVIYGNTPDVNGWGVDHMLALVGVFRIMSGTIGLIIAPNMRMIMEDVRSGGLDFLLLRPVDSQFLASVRRVSLGRAADIVLGLALAATAVARLGGGVAPGALAGFFVMLLAATAIMYSFWLILATLSFWLVRVQNLEMVFWNVFEAARYPVSIYPPPVKWLLTFVVPAAFVVTVPAQTLVGGLGHGGADAGGPVGAGMLIAAAVLAGAMFVVATWFWRFGVKRYSGASA